MSAPIPSFFKIRCVLVILSFLLFFMLIGMTRRAFSASCSGLADGSFYKNGSASCVYQPHVNYYNCSSLASAACNADGDGCLTISSWFNLSTGAGLPVGTLGYWRRGSGVGCDNVSDDIYIYVACTADTCSSCPDERAALEQQCGEIGYILNEETCEGQCANSECSDESTALSQQCGVIGYTMIDEENCKGRCNDCVQEAEGQCLEPKIIVWNEDGDCSYNCSGDADGDGMPDIEDPDDDNDGIDDDDDPCPTDPDPACEYSPPNVDTDGDGIPDREDDDDDGDGILDSEDDDDDGDGVKDVSDFDADIDGDGLLNWEDDDDDGDGILDVDDPDADPDGDGKTNDEDDDDDNDGVPDVQDPDNAKYKSDEPAYSVNSTLPDMLQARFHQFLDDVKMSSLFSIPERIKQGLPSGGDSSLSIDMGETFGGTHVVDYSGWSQGLAALNAIIYTVCSGIAIRIIILKR